MKKRGALKVAFVYFPDHFVTKTFAPLARSV